MAFDPDASADLDLESPWEDVTAFAHDQRSRENEWTKLSSDFTNAGYREGITAGKESSLQEGFDAGFSQIGVPLGREIGVMRGVISALLTILKSSDAISDPSALTEAQDISSRLSEIRYSDIAPRDLEAEAHAREHLETYGENDEEMNVVDEELKGKRDDEQLEDMLSAMSTRDDVSARSRPNMDEVVLLRQRLESCCRQINLAIDMS